MKLIFTLLLLTVAFADGLYFFFCTARKLTPRIDNCASELAKLKAENAQLQQKLKEAAGQSCSAQIQNIVGTAQGYASKAIDVVSTESKKIVALIKEKGIPTKFLSTHENSLFPSLAPVVEQQANQIWEKFLKPAYDEYTKISTNLPPLNEGTDVNLSQSPPTVLLFLS